MQCNQSVTKPEGTEIFFIKSRFHLVWVLKVWILRIPDLWECIKVLHERQISILKDFV